MMKSKDYIVDRVGRLGRYTPPTLRFFVTALRSMSYIYELYNVVVPHCQRVFVLLTYSDLPYYVYDVASVLHVVVHPYPVVENDEELRIWLVDFVCLLPNSITHYE